VRLFVALPVPAGVRRAVGERIEAERGELPPARWVRPENLHLTLVFLGELAADRVPDLVAALAPAFAAHPTLRLRLAGAGCFPPPPRSGRRRPARVAWIGVEADGGDEGLRALQADVAAAAAESVGHRPDDRPWSPHLTLARPRPPWPARDADAFERAFAPPAGEPFVAARGVLVASELGKGAGGGALYRDVESFALAAAGGETAAEAGASARPAADASASEAAR